ncbi:MAG TPA: tetratricopeptide repeat protein [Syntrophorhabdaceae bacterium]|nr:tetratricopeptide repeat protein [Syntrophorhabdaceae bacterium]
MEISECPQCGAAASPADRKCGYCKAEFFVTSLAYLGSFDSGGVGKYLKHYKELNRHDPHNIEGLLGLGLCYLQMGTYPLAQKCFEQIIEASPDVSGAYYYYALASIKGRRIMTLSLNEARQLETYLNTAIQIDGEIPQYKLLLAMLKRDYYETNGMKVPPPSATELLFDIEGQQINKNEIEHLRASVKVGKEAQYYEILTVV